MSSIKLQLILVMGQKTTVNGQTDIIEEIIGIATVTVFYPLQEYLDGFKMFRFDKSLDSKGTIKARIKLQKQQVAQSPKTPKNRTSPTKLRLKTVSMSNSSSEPESEEEKQRRSPLKQRTKTGIDGDKYKQMVQSLTQQRNQLYKMSEQLYAQLQRCIDERDQYLRQLREKVLNEEMTRAQLQFLKMKINQYDQAHHHAATNLHSYDQIEDLKKYNEDLLTIIQEKDKTIHQLERQVKESLVALNQFKKEALTARDQLLHKQSQLSMLTQQKSFDPLDCIQQLRKELEERHFEYSLDLTRVTQEEGKIEDALTMVKIEINTFVREVQRKMKDHKQKQWLLKEKLSLERRIDEKVGEFFYERPHVH